MTLIERVMQHEGFRATPYIDPLVAHNPEAHGITREQLETAREILAKLKLTFGYGFTYISKEEAEAVLEIRLKKIARDLDKKFSFFEKLPVTVQQALVEMAYQLGIGGVSKFKKMLAALEAEDWCEAYKEGKDSRWYRQTPKRAEAVLSAIKYYCKKN